MCTELSTYIFLSLIEHARTAYAHDNLTTDDLPMIYRYTKLIDHARPAYVRVEPLSTYIITFATIVYGCVWGVSEMELPRETCLIY